MSAAPALVRAAQRYQPCYCEENVWHLAAAPELAALERHVVFISNPARRCAVWAQRSAPAPGEPVLWDYHVILLARAAGEAWVYDLDTVLPFPERLEAYLEGAFPMQGTLPEALEPRFRVVEAERFREVFASDRSHMRRAGGGWSAPPPPWPRLGAGAMNLSRFVEMEAPFEGEVLELAGLLQRFSRRGSRAAPPR